MSEHDNVDIELNIKQKDKEESDRVIPLEYYLDLSIIMVITTMCHSYLHSLCHYHVSLISPFSLSLPCVTHISILSITIVCHSYLHSLYHHHVPLISPFSLSPPHHHVPLISPFSLPLPCVTHISILSVTTMCHSYLHSLYDHHVPLISPFSL